MFIRPIIIALLLGLFVGGCNSQPTHTRYQPLTTDTVNCERKGKIVATVSMTTSVSGAVASFEFTNQLDQNVVVWVNQGKSRDPLAFEKKLRPGTWRVQSSSDKTRPHIDARITIADREFRGQTLCKAGITANLEPY